MERRRTARRKTLFYREFIAISRWSYRFAVPIVLLSAVLTLPAFMRARTLGLDTDLTRLLPQDSDAVRWSRELEPVVGDGGYFSVVVEDGDAAGRQRAVDALGVAFAQLDGVSSVDYRYPTDFAERYKYALLPVHELESMLDTVDDWEAEVNPFLDDLGGSDDDAATDTAALEDLLDRYLELPEYHESPDGDMLGMIVLASEGLSDLGRLRDLYRQMAEMADEQATSQGVSIAIGGSLRTQVEEFDVIVSDVTRTGVVAALAILITLGISFRSIRILPVLIYPLSAGLIWAFAMLPSLVGDLNTITSFLLMVLFGMGVDYAIHLVKRFRHELLHHDVEHALCETFTSTGRSVATSGVTTSFGLYILAISEFRGFSDFGWIGGTSILLVTLAMLLLMPATLVIGWRLGLVDARAPRIPSQRWAIPPSWAAATLSTLVILSAGAAGFWLSFDYDFSNFSANLEELDAIRVKQEEIYPVFFGPSAVYVAPDLPRLDRALAVFRRSADEPDSHIASIASVRDFAPGRAEAERRRELIEEIQERLQGRWVRRVEDPDRVRLIDDFRSFEVPEQLPSIGDIPTTLSERFLSRDGAGEFVIGLNALGNGKDGEITMAFTREIYDLDLPDGIRGPTGDKPVLAEILWLVTSEAPLIVILSYLGIFVLVVIDRRDVNQASWVLMPLIASLLLTFGVMLLLGWKLNFFNMVVLPTLLGLGVDHGVHYYRRWRELGRDTAATQLELFEPITVATITTVMGYAGMAFAHHPGLRSIGVLAVVGLLCTWATAVILLPGLLGWRENNREALALPFDTIDTGTIDTAAVDPAQESAESAEPLADSETR